MDGDAKEQRAQKVREEICRQQPAGGPQQSQPQRVSKDEMADVRALRAQGRTDSKLFEGLRQGVGQDGINPHTRQNQSQAGENGNQAGAEPWLRGGVIDQRLHVAERYYDLRVFSVDDLTRALGYGSASTRHSDN